ncbi:MAG: TadE/TadG family type IV pilus assembly protein [Gemmataceae bacterium]
MSHRSMQSTRSGTTIVEGAFMLPVALFFIIATFVGAMGVFRYQQVAHLAREGARWAAVRGTQYQFAMMAPEITPQDVYANAIQPHMVALDPDLLSYSVTWEPNKRPGSVVTVTVTYRWIPEVFLDEIALSSTSRMVMSY